MSQELVVLYVTAASIGFFHTILGPDHYLPFIVMGKARNWSALKVGVVTFLCGVGHIASSIVLGLVGVAFGVAVMQLESIESLRGNVAVWALIGFGFAYFLWGIRKARQNRPHSHAHLHEKYSEHSHLHVHADEHYHVHDEEAKSNITPWVLFTIFVLGPCEPLIPILMYPAAKKSLSGLIGVTVIFGLVTILTMMSVVMLVYLGIRLVPLGKLDRYSHALAGATILLSGLAIQLLGL